MKTRSESTRSRFSFFHREPKFSILIVALSLLVLLAATLLLGLYTEHPFSSFFCHQATEGCPDVAFPNIRHFLEQITSGLARMPR